MMETYFLTYVPICCNKTMHFVEIAVLLLGLFRSIDDRTSCAPIVLAHGVT